jgi:hypothetical protein
MKPFSSSSEKENCSPLSSNCVEWQGPFISCINICKGDSVSDIVYKLSEKVCNIADGTTIDNINVSCILDACPSIAAPSGSLGSLLQTIVDGICCSVGSLNQQTSQLYARTSNLYNEPSLVLPTNFQYTDPSTGLPVASLPLSSFAQNTATNTSALRTTVDRQTVQISNQEVRVQSLENNPGYIPPTVTPLGTYGSVIAGVPTQMNLLLQAVEGDYTVYKTSIGTQSDLTKAANAQTPFLGASETLSGSGTMSGITGWNNTVSNLAQSVNNLWLTVSDVRAAVESIKQNIIPDCSTFILGFTSTADSARANVTVIFNALTTIPSGFTNCPKLSTITITDGLNTYSNTLNLTTAATNPSGIVYPVSGAGLNPALPYTITVNGCIVNGGTVCSKSVSIINQITTTTTTVALPKQWAYVVQQLDVDDAKGNTDTTLNGKVYVSYLNECGFPVVNSYTAAIGGLICVQVGQTPIIYYYKSNVLHTGTSSVGLVGTCSVCAA